MWETNAYIFQNNAIYAWKMYDYILINIKKKYIAIKTKTALRFNM